MPFRSFHKDRLISKLIKGGALHSTKAKVEHQKNRILRTYTVKQVIQSYLLYIATTMLSDFKSMTAHQSLGSSEQCSFLGTAKYSEARFDCLYLNA